VSKKMQPAWTSHAQQLRDGFAKAALTALLSTPHGLAQTEEWLARRAYEFADEMMKARTEEPAA
jgi:hypothetical protein